MLFRSDKPLKLRLRRGNSELDAIRFNVEDDFKRSLPQRLRVTYRLGINEYNGVQTPQLLVEHLEAV